MKVKVDGVEIGSVDEGPARYSTNRHRREERVNLILHKVADTFFYVE